MLVSWVQFERSLGTKISSEEFNQLCLAIGEKPIISQDQGEYNVPLGEITYYSFIHSGIEIGFRENLLNHIHFYFNTYEGYEKYKGKLIANICDGWSEDSVLCILGLPSLRGGGKDDLFLGCINYWIKYQYPNYELNFQFKHDDLLSRCTLIFKSN